MNSTVTVVQVTMTVKGTEFLIPSMLHVQKWPLDSGACCHCWRSAEGLTDVKEIDETIKIGNGDSMKWKLKI
jgi:hypothetical protein